MLKCELKKLLSKRIYQIVIAMTILLIIPIIFFAVGSVRFTNENGGTEVGITAPRKLLQDKNKWEGSLTEEKLTEIINIEQDLQKQYPEGIPNIEYGTKVQSYYEVLAFVVQVYTPDSEYDESVISTLTDVQIENFYADYESNMEMLVEEYGETVEQKAFLSERYQEINTPIFYEGTDSWDTMGRYASMYGVILILVAGFLAAGIFVEDFQNDSAEVFYATRYGRTKATKNKIVVGVIIITALYWGAMTIMSLGMLLVMGTSGSATMYQITEPYSFYLMNYGQYYLLILLSGYIGSLFSASVSMVIASKTQSVSIASSIPVVLFTLSPFIGRTLAEYTSVFNIAPYVLTNLPEYTKGAVMFQVGDVVLPQVYLVIILYGIVSLGGLPFVYRWYGGNGLKKTKIK